MALPPDAWDCIDCGQDTRTIDEYYMVKNDVWPRHPQHPTRRLNGMLCIGCLEARLERKLTEDDFTHYPVNVDGKFSPRLRNRLGNFITTHGPAIMERFRQRQAARLQ